MPPGSGCCIVGCTSHSHNCYGRKQDHGLRFFCIPAVKKTQGTYVEEVTTKRRRAWISAIRRPCVTFEKASKGMRVCSRHFHSGKPAYEMMESDPDWAPSLFLGHIEVKETNVSRHQRLLARMQNAVTAEVIQDLTDHQEHAVADHTTEDNDTAACTAPAMGTQTELCAEDIEEVYKKSAAMQKEINRLLEENRTLKDKLEKKEITESAFEGDSEKVKYYTGLPSFATLMVLCGHIFPFLPQGTRRLLSPFQMILVSLMRLRLNLPVQHIAYIFQVHRTTISKVFVDTICVMHSRISNLVFWPDRDCLRVSMPHEFVEAFGRNVAVIIDCFEIFIEKPSNLKARAQTFSHYKHAHTMKYLIGITPQGVISFISKGWGGRASDKHVTENSGFLNNLLPNDIVLADRGFDIHESVGLMCAEVKIPAFTRGKAQMHAKDIESTRKLAHLRIHVERVIGNVVMKYTILSDTIPINLVLPFEDEELTVLDKIVNVCCALTNMCPSVV